MRPVDRLRAGFMHATARWTVRYGDELRFAGNDLPAPARLTVPTRHGDVGVQVYRDPGWGPRPHGWVVHLHGGAWLMRYPEMDDFWCRYLVAMAGVVVVNVDFHAAPQVAYPVAQEEAYDAVAWLHEHGGDDAVVARTGVVLDPDRLAVSGFSSGGGMAASVCLQARDSGRFSPRLQVLGVPALDLASPTPTGAGMISPALRGLVRRVYFPDVERRREAYASPLLVDDVAGLPPAVVLVAEHDTLRPDGEAWARRLTHAGIPVTFDVTPGADHYFLSHDLRRARTTMAVTAAAVEAHLAA